MVFRFLLVLALASGLGFAQRTVNPRTGMPRTNDPFGTDRTTRSTNPRREVVTKTANRLDVIAEQLKLDKDQKKQVKGIFDAAAKQAASVREQFHQSRMELAAAVRDGKTEAEIEKAAAKLGPIEAQMVAIETKALAKLMGVLKDDQKRRADQVFAERMAGIFQSKKWNEPD